MKREYVVISVGGSLIVPDAIDMAFLTKFRELILRKVAQGFSFFIVTGGGKLARNYQEAARAVRAMDGLDGEDADWLGIQSTRLNAHLLRTIFSEEARSRIVKDPTKRLNAHDSIVIGGGWKPGNSSDLATVMAAKTVGARKMVNLSNIDYVYTADPRTNPDAEKIETIAWPDFRKLIPEEWDPGLSSPFDPVAAREAEALDLEVAVINGAKLIELEKYLDGQPFIGTIIK